MQIISPVQVTPLNLVATNVPIDDAPAWSAGSYSIGDRVVKDYYVYESVADTNTAVPGEETVVPFKWINLGAVNAYLMFNKRVGNKWLINKFTTNPASIDITIRPGKIVNSIGFTGVSATSIQVIMTTTLEGVVYDRTIPMTDPAVNNWYAYWFSPIGRRDNTVFLNLPAYSNADIQILATSEGGAVIIGNLVMGRRERIGNATYGSSLGSESYSRTTEDEFGNVSIISRGYRRYAEFDVVIMKAELTSVERLLNSLRDEAAMYIGAEDIPSTIIIGRLPKLRTVLSNMYFCETSLEIRSLE